MSEETVKTAAAAPLTRAEKRAIKKADPGYVGAGKFWAWMSREFSDSALVFLFGYLQLYCTDVIYINPLVVGTVIAVSKIIDAVTDVIAGYVVDRTNTRWGKGRPYSWLQFGAWISLVLLYSTPTGFSDVQKVAWVSGMYILAKGVFGTMLDASENVYRLRAFNEPQLLHITGASAIATSLVGLSMGILVPQAVKAAGNDPAAWSKYMILFAVPLSVIGMIRFFGVKEVYDYKEDAKEKVHLKDMFTMLGKNKHIWPLFLVNLVSAISGGMGVAVYYLKYILGDLGLQSVFSAALIFAIIPLLFLPRIMKRLTYRQVIVYGGLIAITSGVVMFIFRYNVPVLVIGTVISQAATVPAVYVSGLILLQCADYNEYIGLHRLEGTMSAAIGFAKNVGAALGAFLLGVALTVIKYDASMETISKFTENGITVLMFGVPMLSGLLQLLFMNSYRLEDSIDEVRAANEERRKAFLADSAE